jgi:hypothetical protein
MMLYYAVELRLSPDAEKVPDIKVYIGETIKKAIEESSDYIQAVESIVLTNLEMYKKVVNEQT